MLASGAFEVSAAPLSLNLIAAPFHGALLGCLQYLSHRSALILGFFEVPAP